MAGCPVRVSEPSGPATAVVSSMKVCEAANARHGLAVAVVLAWLVAVATAVAGGTVAEGDAAAGWLADSGVAEAGRAAGAAALLDNDVAHDVASAAIASIPRADIHRAVVTERTPRESKVSDMCDRE